MLPEKHEKQI